MNAFGGGVFDRPQAHAQRSPQNVKSLETLMKWIDQGFMPAEPSTALITSLFNNGKAAMVFSGPWFLGEIAPGHRLRLAPLPTIDEAGGKPMRPWMTVEGVYIAAPSKNKDAAFALAKFLTDIPAGEGACPGRAADAGEQGGLRDAKVAADPILKPSGSRSRRGTPMPNLRR